MDHFFQSFKAGAVDRCAVQISFRELRLLFPWMPVVLLAVILSQLSLKVMLPSLTGQYKGLMVQPTCFKMGSS